jgi:hypothetical protein
VIADSPTTLTGISACVFDAHGTLFDVGSIARGAEDELKELWQRLSDLWRSKQLQYTWLRGLAGHHADFSQVTGDALDYAMDRFCFQFQRYHRPGLRRLQRPDLRGNDFDPRRTGSVAVDLGLAWCRPRRPCLRAAQSQSPVLTTAQLASHGYQ